MLKLKRKGKKGKKKKGKGKGNGNGNEKKKKDKKKEVLIRQIKKEKMFIRINFCPKFDVLLDILQCELNKCI